MKLQPAKTRHYVKSNNAHVNILMANRSDFTLSWGVGDRSACPKRKDLKKTDACPLSYADI